MTLANESSPTQFQRHIFLLLQEKSYVFFERFVFGCVRSPLIGTIVWLFKSPRPFSTHTRRMASTTIRTILSLL